MKKLLTLLLSVCFLSVHAQKIDTLKLKHFSTWSITPFVGSAYGNMDVDENDPFYTKTKMDLGFGVNLAKQLSHYASFQGSFYNTSLDVDMKNSYYNTKINQLDFRMYLHLTNGHTLRNFRNTQLYGYLGYGLVWYDVERFKTNGDTLAFSNGTTRAIPVGVGAKYRLGNRTSIMLDVCYTHTNSDMLDGLKNSLTTRDGYTRASLGISYTFGKKALLEWDNPFKRHMPEEIHDTTIIIREIKYVPEKKKEVVQPDSAVIYFIPGSSSIEFPYLAELDTIIDIAKKNDYSIEIEAYCDSTGSSRSNVQVVQKRAYNVSEYIERYISSDKVSVSLFDETYALYAPSARNRRVVVKLIKNSSSLDIFK